MRDSIEADFVVVGSGSGGSVVAGRLAEGGGRSVVLLEAGRSDKSPKVLIPGLGLLTLLGDSKYDWKIVSEPDPTRGLRTDYMPRGKLLGGTSSINAMCFLRGTPEDFDDWANLGNEGWAFKDVLPFFRNLERFEGGESDLRGGRGPQPVSFLRSRHKMSDIFLEACAQAGAPRIADLNEGAYEGVGYAQASQLKGSRYSAARSYVWPAQERTDLNVMLGSHAQRLIFEGRRVAGVEFSRGGKNCRAIARKGVVLSSGAFGTPHLLMLSGIGPADQLRKMGIDVLVDLPGVGRNLQDHAGTRHMAWVDIPTLNTIDNPWRKFKEGLKWVVNGTGAASSPLTQVVLAHKLDHGNVRSRFSVLFTPGGFEFSPAGSRALERPVITSVINVHRPYSAGWLELKSKDYREQIGVHPNLLGDERDIDTLVAGHQIMRKIHATEPLRSRVVGEYRPGPEVKTDDDLRRYVRETAKGIYHPSGTCKMGQDQLSVVDSKLRVRGVESLYVADASVMPFIVSANLNATCMMIGERLAHWLKQ